VGKTRRKGDRVGGRNPLDLATVLELVNKMILPLVFHLNPNHFPSDVLIESAIINLLKPNCVRALSA